MNKDRRLGIFLEMIEATPNGTITLDEMYRIIQISLNVTKFWKMEPEEVIGKKRETVLPELGELKELDREKAWAYNMIVKEKYYCIVPLNKGEIQNQSRQYLVFDLNQIEKLTLQWLYNNGLALELEEMFEGSFDGMAATDADGKILYVNRAYEQITGITREEMSGKSMADLKNPIWDSSAIIDAVRKPVSYTHLRADMDAQATKEETDLPFRSEEICQWGGSPIPVMHSCGHDVHTAALMAAAQVLVGLRDYIYGTVIRILPPKTV